MQRQQRREPVMQGLQPIRHGVGAVGGDDAVGDVAQPVAVGLDHTPAGKAQAGVNANQDGHEGIDPSQKEPDHTPPRVHIR